LSVGRVAGILLDIKPAKEVIAIALVLAAAGCPTPGGAPGRRAQAAPSPTAMRPLKVP
jgi:hypothetical protein